MNEIEGGYQNLVAHIEELSRRIKSGVELSEEAKKHIEAIRRVSESVQPIREVFDGLLVSGFVGRIQTLVDEIKEIDPQKYHEENVNDLKIRTETFAEMGWALVIDVNGDCIYDESIFEMKSEELDKYMLDFYAENEYDNLRYLEEYISERINPIWKEQLNDAVRFFINGDYKVVIPFVMTLIEAEMIRYSGREKFGVGLRNDFKERIKQVDDDYIFIATLLIDKLMTKIFDNKATDEVEGELLNRNLVLHGKSNPDMWGEVEFLKILNLVGALAMLDDMFEIEKVL